MAKLNSGTRIYGNLQVDTFITASGNVVAASSQASTSTTTGALVVVGGVGIAGATNTANVNVTYNPTSATGVGLTITAKDTQGGTGYADFLKVTNTTSGATNPNKTFRLNSTGAIEIINSSYTTLLFSLTDSGNIVTSGIIDTTSNTQATSVTTGALQVTGGASITTGNLYIGGSGGTAIVHTGHILPSSNLTANLGSPTAWYNTFFGVSTQAKYADLAENYVGDTEYAPGTVLVFGGAKEVTVTNMTHDTRVAGVVSTNPAYLMNSMNGNVSVAMTGRVPCCVQGPVEKGTVLVSSHIPGVAEALNSSMYRPGCVLGKALEKIDSTDIKTIEVVVGRF
jgi:hypothetical protein